MKKILLTAIFVLIFSIQTVLASFSDVSDNHPNYKAINYLYANGIIIGYPDGTFRPEQNVLRAEAVKIIIAPLYETIEEASASPFPDVLTSDWYAKYVLKAKNEGIVAGYGDTGNFEGARNVSLVEYLKILLIAYKINVDDYLNPSVQIFKDVADLNAWYIPYLYYASATNLIHADSNSYIWPAKQLTRAEVAEITYRLIVNIKGGETQLNLSMAEAEMIKILQYLDENNIDLAEYSASNAIKYTQKAYDLAPNESIVQAAKKIAEAFDYLVKCYRAGLEKNYTEAESKAQSAWNAANDSINLNSSVSTLAENIKDIAHDMAELARASM
ncbi:S-layer homology domain-containing protein [Candidatus Peregrinibacteria bacterium]|nr:S-layer homology domain-containing protein [Candidatus Peregrinibacteria bacterium]